MTTSLQRGAPATSGHQPAGRANELWRLAVTVGAGSACVGLAVIVALDGSLLWRVGRVALVVAAGGAVLATRGGPGWLRSGSATLLGAVALVAGVGIGVPHTLAGAWITGGAGLLALLAGTALLLATAIGSWTRSRGWSRVGVILVGLVLAQWIAFPATIAVVATNRAPTPPTERTPADVGLPYRDLTVTAEDGVQLAAWYVPSTNGAAVVLMHGAGSTRASVLGHAEVLSARGYGVLLLDARGHGDSGGHAMDFGWHGDADVAAAVGSLRGSPDVTAGIGAVGMSMGGEQAIGAAAGVPALDAIVAEGVTGRRGADWLPLRPAGIGRWFSGVFYTVQDATAALLSGTDPPIDLRTAVIGSAPRPMLIITGGEVPREAEAGRRLQQAAPDRVDLWDVPGARHTGGLAAAAEEWDARVGGFLERALLD